VVYFLNMTTILLVLAFSVQAAPLERAASVSEAAFQRLAVRMTPLPARSNPWVEVVQKVLDKGQFTQGDEIIPDTLGLAFRRPSGTGSELRDYVNLWGVKGADGVFHPYSATMVSEDWGKDKDGNWVIDQWILELSMEGALKYIAHKTLVEAPDGHVLEVRNDPLEPSDPRVAAKREALIALWAAF